MSATGETDLATLLSSLSPLLAPTPYSISSSPDPDPESLMLAFAVCREAEGVTLIQANTSESDDAPRYARITLRVHSSLEAVGLTAAVSATLGASGIPANMVAGYFHDHVFVPWAMRHEAMQALLALSNQSTAGSSTELS